MNFLARSLCTSHWLAAIAVTLSCLAELWLLGVDDLQMLKHGVTASFYIAPLLAVLLYWHLLRLLARYHTQQTVPPARFLTQQLMPFFFNPWPLWLHRWIAIKCWVLYCALPHVALALLMIHYVRLQETWLTLWQFAMLFFDGWLLIHYLYGYFTPNFGKARSSPPVLGPSVSRLRGLIDAAYANKKTTLLQYLTYLFWVLLHILALASLLFWSMTQWLHYVGPQAETPAHILQVAERITQRLPALPSALLKEVTPILRLAKPDDVEASAWSVATPLQGRRFQFAQLRGLTMDKGQLAHADFSFADLRDTRMPGADFRQARMYMTILDGADLTAANFDGAHMQRAQLSLSQLQRISAKNADFSSASLHGAQFDDADFQGANLSRALLSGSAQRANFASANMQLSRIGEDWSGANLTAAQLDGAMLPFAQLELANLHAATLDGADLRFAKLSGADLSQASLQGADLRYLQAPAANFSATNLRASVMMLANVSGSQWDGADWQGTWVKDERPTPYQYTGDASKLTPVLQARLHAALQRSQAPGKLVEHTDLASYTTTWFASACRNQASTLGMMRSVASGSRLLAYPINIEQARQFLTTEPRCVPFADLAVEPLIDAALRAGG